MHGRGEPPYKNVLTLIKCLRSATQIAGDLSYKNMESRIYGLVARSTKAAMLLWSWTRLSSFKYIMWPAS